MTDDRVRKIAEEAMKTGGFLFENVEEAIRTAWREGMSEAAVMGDKNPYAYAFMCAAAIREKLK